LTGWLFFFSSFQSSSPGVPPSRKSLRTLTPMAEPMKLPPRNLFSSALTLDSVASTFRTFSAFLLFSRDSPLQWGTKMSHFYVKLFSQETLTLAKYFYCRPLFPFPLMVDVYIEAELKGIAANLQLLVRLVLRGTRGNPSGKPPTTFPVFPRFSESFGGFFPLMIHPTYFFSQMVVAQGLDIPRFFHQPGRASHLQDQFFAFTSIYLLTSSVCLLALRIHRRWQIPFPVQIVSFSSCPRRQYPPRWN